MYVPTIHFRFSWIQIIWQSAFFFDFFTWSTSQSFSPEEELQQLQQLINNLEQIEVSQEQRIQDLERQNSRIKGKLHECGLLHQYPFDFLFKIIARESKISQESTRNLRRAFGAEGRIKDLNSQIRSLKYQINSHDCNDTLNKINYKK